MKMERKKKTLPLVPAPTKKDLRCSWMMGFSAWCQSYSVSPGEVTPRELLSGNRRQFELLLEQAAQSKARKPRIGGKSMELNRKKWPKHQCQPWAHGRPTCPPSSAANQNSRHQATGRTESHLWMTQVSIWNSKSQMLPFILGDFNFRCSFGGKSTPLKDK